MNFLTLVTFFPFLLARAQDANGLIRIALVPKSIANPYFDVAGDGCIDGALIFGDSMNMQVNCSYVGPLQDDEDILGIQQAEIIADLIDNDLVDGISVSARNAETLIEVINRAVAKGIPVVTFDSDSPDSMRSAYIGTDNTFFGAQLAKVVKQLQPNGGKYALITSLESPNLQERVRGFQEEMKREKGELWREVPGSPADIESNIDIAIEKMQEFANYDPPPTAIVPVMGAPMRSCCWKDFVNEHRDKNITLVSGDAMANQLEFLDRGYVQGLVGQLPYEMGMLSVETLLKLIQKEDIEGDVIGTNVLSHLLIPLELPPLEVDNNLIGSLSIVGLCLFALIAAAAIGFSCWVLVYRNLIIVKAAQPSFLIMVAAGVLVLASSLIPLSFDDNGIPFDPSDPEAKLMCMSVPWLASTGFTISFSALFAKTMRVNKIFHSKSRFARVEIQPKDIALPFFGLFTANTLILTLWSVLDPLTYTRQDLPGLDGWDRVIATYGTCQSDNVLHYLLPLAAVNLSLLAAANWQAYEARYIESEFSESKYIAMSMASLLQAMLSGIPILFVVRESPQAFYLVIVFMIFIISSAVLLLIFVPKVVLAQPFIGRSDGSQRRLIQESIRARAKDARPQRSSNISGLSNPSGGFSAASSCESQGQDDNGAKANGRENLKSSHSTRGSKNKRNSHFLESLKEDVMIEEDSSSPEAPRDMPQFIGNKTSDSEAWPSECSDVELAHTEQPGKASKLVVPEPPKEHQISNVHLKADHGQKLASPESARTTAPKKKKPSEYFL
jgi:ABC-type sugar transport system substrate-binding protein